VSEPVEKSIHAYVHALLQKISDEHGICVDLVDTAWVDVSLIGGDKHILTDLRIGTTTKGTNCAPK